MRRRDLSTVTIEDAERRMVIALGKMSARQSDIFLSVRLADTSYEALAERHGITIDVVTDDFARALRIWSRCLHARCPQLVWPWH